MQNEETNTRVSNSTIYHPFINAFVRDSKLRSLHYGFTVSLCALLRGQNGPPEEEEQEEDGDSGMVVEEAAVEEPVDVRPDVPSLESLLTAVQKKTVKKTAIPSMVVPKVAAKDSIREGTVDSHPDDVNLESLLAAAAASSTPLNVVKKKNRSRGALEDQLKARIAANADNTGEGTVDSSLESLLAAVQASSSTSMNRPIVKKNTPRAPANEHPMEDLREGTVKSQSDDSSLESLLAAVKASSTKGPIRKKKSSKKTSIPSRVAPAQLNGPPMEHNIREGTVDSHPDDVNLEMEFEEDAAMESVQEEAGEEDDEAPALEVLLKET